MVTLPPVPDLVQRTKALAALDLILSPEWLYRYYSFNQEWAPQERMASMRNGCGDEWWMVFHDSGWAALKGLAKDSEAWSEADETLSGAIQKAFPQDLRGFSEEPAFCWDSTSFGYFLLPQSDGWVYANACTPLHSLDSGDGELLQLLTGTPKDYMAFASEYYEADIPEEVVESIFSLAPITEEMVLRLNPETTLADIAGELFSEIGYPR